jgi:hypothetical protein
MIPECNDDGYLPAGIHPASVDEIAARFGQESELRQAQMESLRWLVDLARRAGVRRIVVNGSFVTDKLEPNDVDCVLLIDRISRTRPPQKQKQSCWPVYRSSTWNWSIQLPFDSSPSAPLPPTESSCPRE